MPVSLCKPSKLHPKARCGCVLKPSALVGRLRQISEIEGNLAHIVSSRIAMTASKNNIPPSKIGLYSRSQAVPVPWGWCPHGELGGPGMSKWSLVLVQMHGFWAPPWAIFSCSQLARTLNKCYLYFWSVCLLTYKCSLYTKETSHLCCKYFCFYLTFTFYGILLFGVLDI